MDTALFSDGQVAALTTAIVAGLGAIAAAIRWGLGRYAKAFDDMGAAFKVMADEHKLAREALVRLEGTVDEGRDDIREVRDRVEISSGEHPIRRHRRAQANPAGERGSVAGVLLAWLACAGVVFAAERAWSCSGTQRRATAGAVVDCTLVSIGDHAAEIEAAIRARDWTHVRATVQRLGVDVGGCVLRAAIAAVLKELHAESFTARGPSEDELREQWERIRADQLGGRRYLPEAR